MKRMKERNEGFLWIIAAAAIAVTFVAGAFMVHDYTDMKETEYDAHAPFWYGLGNLLFQLGNNLLLIAVIIAGAILAKTWIGKRSSNSTRTTPRKKRSGGPKLIGILFALLILTSIAVPFAHAMSDDRVEQKLDSGSVYYVGAFYKKDYFTVFSMVSQEIILTKNTTISKITIDVSRDESVGDKKYWVPLKIEFGVHDRDLLHSPFEDDISKYSDNVKYIETIDQGKANPYITTVIAQTEINRTGTATLEIGKELTPGEYYITFRVDGAHTTLFSIPHSKSDVATDAVAVIDETDHYTYWYNCIGGACFSHREIYSGNTVSFENDVAYTMYTSNGTSFAAPPSDETTSATYDYGMMAAIGLIVGTVLIFYRRW